MKALKPPGSLFAFGVCLALVAGCSKTPDPDENPASKSGAAQSEQVGGVTLDPATQARIGLAVAIPQPTQWEPEMTAYGVVLDPASLAASEGDLSAAELAAEVSDREYARQQALAAQNNISARSLETARAAALHDEAAKAAEQAKFTALWGTALTERAKDILALIASQQSALVRLDLPAGENLSTPPLSAGILLATSDTNPISATYLDTLPGVDPQSQSQSFLFLLDHHALPANAAVTGFLKTSGPALHGVTVPAAAVLRYEGKGWVYVQSATNQFQRVEIPLDHSVTDGWFVPDTLPLTNGIVVTGAQTVLSAELSGGAFNTGERD